MQLMYDIDSKSNVIIEESVNEANQVEKKYRIKGIFSTMGEQNRNKRTYPNKLWETEVSKYQNTLKTGSINCLMEYEHPARSNVDPMKAVAKIEKLYIDGKYVMGEAVLLNNPEANQLKSLIDNGIKISVSSRGVGSVKNGIVESFNLITYDIVSEPSDYNATMNGICESFRLNEGILQGKTFEMDNGVITETQKTDRSECLRESDEDIEKSKVIVQDIFENILKESVMGNSKYYIYDGADLNVQFDRNFTVTSKNLNKLYADLQESAKFNNKDELCFNLKCFNRAMPEKKHIFMKKLSNIIKSNEYYTVSV